MEKIARFGQTVRNNWKKSVLGAIALFFTVDKAKEKYEIHVLMKAACEEAAKHGDAEISMDRNPKLVTVILNPVANKRKAKQDYEKYCEPLLHLAGLQVDVIQTTSEGNAKQIIENLKGTEAIIVAGGDGTLSEIITGLMRRNDNANQFPLGILPLGRTNTVGNTLFPPPGEKGVKKVRQLVDASMAIVKGDTIWKDAMKIEPILTEEETPSRPIYAMSSIEWGAFRDALAKRDKYWIYGSLRDYACFVFNGYKDSLTWNCSGTIKYTPPCSGCSNCLQKRAPVQRKWGFFLPSPAHAQPQHDPSQLVNPLCSKTNELCFRTCDFKIKTQNDEHNQPSALSIAIGKINYSYTEFVSEGWDRVNKISKTDPIYARTVELVPETNGDNKMEIDKEEFEVKPIKITILPKVIKLFCLHPNK